MPHPSLTNKTAFVVEPLFLTDEEGVAQFVLCVQGTYDIGAQGEPRLAEQQTPIAIGGRWRGDPATTSLIDEPQVAFVKLSTDVVLLGHAHAAGLRRTDGLVGVRLGPVQKTARVFGDRRYVSSLGAVRISAPQPFEQIPITYERAFGGWDRRHTDPAMHRCEPRNPVGVGFHTIAPDLEGALPNFEDPQHLIRSSTDTPPPAGFGFISPDWQPRLGFAGTYDQTWLKQRCPLLPQDFDRRFFNAASPDLVTPQPLRGDEPGVVIGTTPVGRDEFWLPGTAAPACEVELRGHSRAFLTTVLDTVIVDMDRRVLLLRWRAHLAVRNGAHDVLSIEVHPDEAAAKRVSVGLSAAH